MFGTAYAADPKGEVGHHGPFYAEAEFWVAIAFVIFVALMVWKARKVVTDMLDQRAEAIRKQIDEAETLRREAQDLLADYQRKQSEAYKVAEGIVAEAKAEADRMKVKAEADLETAIKQRERQAMDRIAHAEAQAMADVRNAAVEAAIGATQSLLRERLAAGQGGELVDQAIAELPKRLH
ncbi:MAG: F0F1 ATP synthase subunit B [Alphaproteobacteria bacterium]|nr:F0F1 ATP synthase subunit B [Alphaproteobacteria bacterium]